MKVSDLIWTVSGIGIGLFYGLMMGGLIILFAGGLWILLLMDVRKGDTFIVPKLDRLARSVPDARAIADQLEGKGVKLALGASV